MSQTYQINRNVTKAYITLGSNATSQLGSPANALKFAHSALSSDSVKLVQMSPFYSTPAFPAGSGPDFVNAAASVETTLSAPEFLAFLHEIETEAGRIRTKRWGERVLDLDVVAFGEAIVPDLETYQRWVDLPLAAQKNTAPEQLILPHPRIQDRSFALIPLRDVAPDWVHPVTGHHINALITALSDEDIASVQLFVEH